MEFDPRCETEKRYVIIRMCSLIHPPMALGLPEFLGPVLMVEWSILLEIFNAGVYSEFSVFLYYFHHVLGINATKLEYVYSLHKQMF